MDTAELKLREELAEKIAQIRKDPLPFRQARIEPAWSSQFCS